MATPLESFEASLKETWALKAPGVSGTRIKKLTEIAVKNVTEESKLVMALYSYCKATPTTHKLGALYTVDSIVRVYVDEAKKRNEAIDPLAPEGTFAAGVNRISELIELIIDDAMSLLIVSSTNLKISKLVDIWERAQTFKPSIIASIRNKHFRSTTPPGTPPGKAAVLPPPPAASLSTASSGSDSGNILLALASLAKKTDTPTPPAGASPVPQNAAPNTAATNILSQLSALAGGAQGTNSPQPQHAQPNQNQNQIFNMLSQMQGGQNNGNGLPASIPQNPQMRQQGYQNGQNVQNGHNQYQAPGQGQYYQNQGPNVPHLPNVPQLPQAPLMGQAPGGFNPYDQNQPQGTHAPQVHPLRMPFQQGFPPQGQFDDRRGRDGPAQYGFDDRRAGRDDMNGYSRRNRSRSPPAADDKRSLSHGYAPHGEDERNLPGEPHYRPRNVSYDNSLPQGSFKVLSRTLFVGGVPRGMDERELSHHMRPWGEVQSVILNSERRHAFVKVYSRKEAEAVIAGFNKDGALPLRTRWGVGFGPRDCCNYQHGISIIPIERLTEADKSWVVSAYWGGTGGQPLVSGIVIDEPDIEIGTGISSKAMSKKMPTNSTRNGPKLNRPGEADDQFVKTTASSQDYMNYGRGANNPLSGLFNQGQNGVPQQQNINPQNGNLGEQLANFFQNGASR